MDSHSEASKVFIPSIEYFHHLPELARTCFSGLPLGTNPPDVIRAKLADFMLVIGGAGDI